MRPNRASLSSFVVAASMLTACNQAPPKCSDENTLQLVREIVFGKDYSEKDLKENVLFEYPLATAEDKNIKKTSCEAKMLVGGAYSLPITYASQLDDKNQHIVSVAGIRPGDAIMIVSALRSAVEKAKTPIKEEAVAQPAKPAETSVEPQTQQQNQDQTNDLGNVKADDYEENQEAPAQEAASSASTSFSPSFDCAKASTNAEHLICSSRELSEADLQLSQAYKSAIASTSDKGGVKAAQRSWAKAIRDKCSDTECMLAAYKSRISELSR